MLQGHVSQQLFQLFRHAAALDPEYLLDLRFPDPGSRFHAKPDSPPHDDYFSSVFIIGRDNIIVDHLFYNHVRPSQGTKKPNLINTLLLFIKFGFACLTVTIQYYLIHNVTISKMYNKVNDLFYFLFIFFIKC